MFEDYKTDNNMQLKLRRVERLGSDGTWVEIQFSEIKQGDKFRLFEPDGLPGEDGTDVSTALTDAKPCKAIVNGELVDGNWGVQVQENQTETITTTV